MTLRRPSLKVGLIVMASVIISTLGIQASDLLQGVSGSLTGLVSQSTGSCGPHAVRFLTGQGALCVDVYEASPGNQCPVSVPENGLGTVENLTVGTCVAASQPGVLPWRYVNQAQAMQLCARTGKRLPTTDEWYRLAVATPEPDHCAIDTGGTPELTGASQCMTALGAHDLVGNVWEWMAETITDGQYADRQLPESGYVAAVDDAGIVVTTAERAPVSYGEDYASINTSGVRGIVRGGFYGSKSDAGIFAQNVSIAPDFTSAGIGFRCVRDVE